jgi:hypothetical protein
MLIMKKNKKSSLAFYQSFDASSFIKILYTCSRIKVSLNALVGIKYLRKVHLILYKCTNSLFCIKVSIHANMCMKVSKMLYESIKHVVWKYQTCCMKVSNMLYESIKHVVWKYQTCCMKVSSRRSYSVSLIRKRQGSRASNSPLSLLLQNCI